VCGCTPPELLVESGFLEKKVKNKAARFKKLYKAAKKKCNRRGPTKCEPSKGSY
jgi:hypothetical protein